MGKLGQPKRCLAVTATVLLASGCSSTSNVEKIKSYINDPVALRVVVQFCLPDKTAYFDELSVDVTDMPDNLTLAEYSQIFQDARKYGKNYHSIYETGKEVREFQSIRQWRLPSKETDFSQPHIDSYRVTRDSFGMPSAYLYGSTDSDQPVFLVDTHERPTDLVAVSATFRRSKDGSTEFTNFWFTLPKAMERGHFSRWMLPQSEEVRDTSDKGVPINLLLVNGKEMPILPVGANAPRARFMLLNAKEIDALLYGELRARRAKMLSRMMADPKYEFKHEYIRPIQDRIPSCQIAISSPPAAR